MNVKPSAAAMIYEIIRQNREFLVRHRLCPNLRLATDSRLQNRRLLSFSTKTRNLCLTLGSGFCKLERVDFDLDKVRLVLI